MIVTWKVSTIGLMVAQTLTCQRELKQQPLCRGSAMFVFAPGHEESLLMLVLTRGEGTIPNFDPVTH